MHPLEPYLNAFYSRFPVCHRLEYRIARRLRLWLRIPTERDYRIFRSFRGLREAVFVDIGANLGQTIDAVRMAGWDCTLFSFEPNPVLYRRLAGLYRGDERLHLRNLALGAREGPMTLYAPRYRSLVFDGLASLERDQAMGWLSRETLLGFDPERLSCLEMSTRVVTLDGLGLDPFFVKIDVQGLEPEVLRGARETIERSRPVILVETPSLEREVAFLSDLGYETLAFDGEALHRGRLGGLNTFFFPRERLGELASAHGLRID